jgi:hypothetical protein
VAHHRICEEATMDKLKRSTPTKRLLLVAVTFLLLSGPLSAHANIIYTWTGTCVNTSPLPPCTGPATLLVVTTDAYIPGEQYSRGVTATPLLVALYADSNATIDFAAYFNSSNGFAFLLPAASGPEEGYIVNEGSIFHSFLSGDWSAGAENVLPPDHCCGYLATGVDGVWTRQPSMPAPSTLVLLGVGLAGLVFYRRRWLG